MRTAIAGSTATDHLTRFPGRFAGQSHRYRDTPGRRKTATYGAGSAGR